METKNENYLKSYFRVKSIWEANDRQNLENLQKHDINKTFPL